MNKNQPSRLEKGEYKDFDLLSQHASRLKKEYRFFVVQPGLSKSKVTDDILTLLGSTGTHVLETTGHNMKVISS